MKLSNECTSEMKWMDAGRYPYSIFCNGRMPDGKYMPYLCTEQKARVRCISRRFRVEYKQIKNHPILAPVCKSTLVALGSYYNVNTLIC